MATKSIWNEEDEELNGQKSTSMESGVIGGGGQAPGMSGPTKTTGFTNLEQYLNVNKGAGNAIADSMLKSTNEEIGKTSGAIDSWADSAKKKAQDSTLKDEWSDKIKSSSADDLNKIDNNAFQSWKNLGKYWNTNKSGALVTDATQDDDYYDTFKKSQDMVGKIGNANTWQGQMGLAKDAFAKASPNYTSGMGTLDAFVARGDAQGKFDTFKDQNKDFGNKIGAKAGEVNATISGAKDQGQRNYDSVMNAISQRIQGIQGDADKRAGQVADEQYRSLYDSVSKEFAPYEQISSINAYVNPNRLNTSDLLNQAEIDALNRLGGMDDDLATGSYAKTNNQAYSVDRAKIDADLAAAKEAHRLRQPPVVTTDKVSSGAPGDKIGNDYTTTTYPDGSYDVRGPQGEVVHYNADGTIKGTSGTNIFN